MTIAITDSAGRVFLDFEPVVGWLGRCAAVIAGRTTGDIETSSFAKNNGPE